MSPRSGREASLRLGSLLFVVLGVSLSLYALVFIVWAHYGQTVEIGIGAAELGATRSEIHDFAPRLLDYLEHLHVALGGFMLGLGAAVVGLAWSGIRRGHVWSLWTILAATGFALIVATPLHYVHGFATLSHVGPLYVGILLALLATWCSLRGLTRAPHDGKA